MKKNGTEILSKNNPNIQESLRKINSLDSTSSSFRPQKLKRINEFSPLRKMSENTTPKKVLDFPICLSLFTNNKTINSKETKMNKINLNLKDLKPKNLNNLNLNEIIKPNNKKIISRNNSNYFNSLSSIKSKKISTNSRIFSPKKLQKLSKIKLDYSPSNIIKNSPIIINQKGLNPIIKFNTKLNTLSQNTIEPDLSSIKNIKGLSINNLNYNINFNDKKMIPSLISSPINSENLKKENREKIISKKIIKQIKKKVQKKIYNFEKKNYNNNSINKRNKNNNSINKINKNNNSINKRNKNNNSINKRNKNNNNSSNKKNEENIKTNEKINDKKNEEKNNENNKEIKVNNKNELEVIQSRINYNKKNTFHQNSIKYAKKKFNFEKKVNHKFSSNVVLYRVDPDLDKDNLVKKNSVIILDSKKEINENESNDQNQNNTINSNKAKMARLNRIKNFTFKKGNKENKKIVINSVKEEDLIKNGNIKIRDSKFKLSKKKENDKIQFVLGIERSMDKKKEQKDDEFVRAKSSKNLASTNINIFNIKKNNFYLTNCKNKTNIYEENKFLKKCNNNLNEISSNNRINRKIYVRKTRMLLHMKENVGNLISQERTCLQKTQFEYPDIHSYYDKIPNIWKQNARDEMLMNKYFIKNNIYGCKICKNLYNHLMSTTDFIGFSSKIQTIIVKKKTMFNEREMSKQPTTRKRFQTVKIRNISVMQFNKEQKLVDEFSINKTRNVDEDWTYSPINLLSIQEIILRSNNYYYNMKVSLRSIKIRRSTVKKNFNKNNSLNYENNDINDTNRNKLTKQLSLKKFSQLDFSTLKKNLKKTLGKSNYYYDFSLLNQKKFFKRGKVKYSLSSKNIIRKKGKIKSNSKNSFLSSRSSEKSSSENSDLGDIYYQLLSHIIEGKNKQFLKLFEQNKRFIDINQQLIEGNTLLIISAREGNLMLTKFLCTEGIKVNIQNDKGNTALHYAIGNQFYSVADTLTRFGAREDIANNKGLLPWDCVENNLE